MDVVDYKEGVLLLIDKPREWTSFDVVNKLRYKLKIKKIGHAGTLDPLATGLLIIGVGKFTKKLNELQGLDKVYEGIISIGKTTPSYDLETEFDSEADISGVTAEAINQAVLSLTGAQNQIPPVYSAIKVDGERAYKQARRKEDIKLQPRPVTIYEFEVNKIDGADLYFRVKCSKGTYIRSIAYDLGALLGVGGYLKELRRTEVGPYNIFDAAQLDDFIKKLEDAGH
jgi:tRNA pseudouridine55 synthase